MTDIKSRFENDLDIAMPSSTKIFRVSDEQMLENLKVGGGLSLLLYFVIGCYVKTTTKRYFEGSDHSSLIFVDRRRPSTTVGDGVQQLKRPSSTDEVKEEMKGGYREHGRKKSNSFLMDIFPNFLFIAIKV